MEKEQKEREVAELQTRLALEEQREEEKGKEAFTLKQKLAEAEVSRDSLKREVGLTFIVGVTSIHQSHNSQKHNQMTPSSSSPPPPLSYLWPRSGCWTPSPAGGALSGS